MNTYEMTRSPLDDAMMSDLYTIERNLLPPHWLTEIDHLIFLNLECAKDPEDPEELSWAYIKNMNT